MSISRKLSERQARKIASLPARPDDENPEVSDGLAGNFRLAHMSHPEWYSIKPVKKQITIKIDADILETLKAEGRGYQTRINSILREAVFGKEH